MNYMPPTTPAGDLDATDLNEAVRSTAMLADVTISTWSAERTDHAIMDKAKMDAGAVGNVGRAVKNLLAGADGLLKDTRSAYAAVRSTHFGLTLPWVADPHAERMRGPRLLPNMLFERYLGEIAVKKRVALAALDKFVADYPALVVQAQANLAGLANASDYPTPAEVHASFRIGLDFEPIPSGQTFRGLPDHVLEKLSNGLRKKQERMIETASTSMWVEVRERIEYIAARMADDEARFKSSTVESVRDLAVLLPGWNIASDPRAIEIAADISGMLDGVSSETIRKNVHVRKDVADQAQAVADKLTQWGL